MRLILFVLLLTSFFNSVNCSTLSTSIVFSYPDLTWEELERRVSMYSGFTISDPSSCNINRMNYTFTTIGILAGVGRISGGPIGFAIFGPVGIIGTIPYIAMYAGYTETKCKCDEDRNASEWEYLNAYEVSEWRRRCTESGSWTSPPKPEYPVRCIDSVDRYRNDSCVDKRIGERCR